MEVLSILNESLNWLVDPCCGISSTMYSITFLSDGVDEQDSPIWIRSHIQPLHIWMDQIHEVAQASFAMTFSSNVLWIIRLDECWIWRNHQMLQNCLLTRILFKSVNRPQNFENLDIHPTKLILLQWQSEKSWATYLCSPVYLYAQIGHGPQV